jgi:tetratricopeptide (TPR) repeat protein
VNPTQISFYHRRLIWCAIALVTTLALMLVLFHRPLADRLWPEARAQVLRDQAAHELKRGHLTALDGSGARELYQAALAIDPDRNEARVGLMRVAEAALVQARNAMAADHYVDAHRVLQLARELSAPREATGEVELLLRQREATHVGMADLLARAAAARKAHRLEGSEDAALPLYRRVLSLEPDRIEALEGREDALAELLQQAHQALQHDDLVGAARLIAVAHDDDPGHADLPDVQARMAKALDLAHQRASGDLRRGDLSSAAKHVHVLLQIDPGDAAAQRLLEQVANAWAHRAVRMAADFHFDAAAIALEKARAESPQAIAIRAAEHAILRSKLASQRIASSVPTAQLLRRVRVLLVEAEAAESRGDLMTPPGESAFDKLRAARALAPDDAAVRLASRRLLPVANACFDRELRRNNLARAQACLDARVTLGGEANVNAHGRRRLALRWLAVGDERLSAGQVATAQAALAHARQTDPATPGIAEFVERLRIAGGH